MFSGIIQDIGYISHIQITQNNTQLTIILDKLKTDKMALGDSIAVNGVCLTIIALYNHSFKVDVSDHTLSLTVLGKFTKGQRVNLETALTLNQGINGHLVSGHIDNIAQVVAVQNLVKHCHICIKVPKMLDRYLVKKGSVCVNGVSLTINEIKNCIFSLNIVPHTLKSTTLSELVVNDSVNIEVDLFAKQLEKLMIN